MKKNVLLLMASALVCLVACNKEVEIIEDTPEQGTPERITEVIGAGLEADYTKAVIDDELAFSWRNGADRLGDYVAFWNGTTFVRSGASSTAGATTTFNITYNGTRSAYAYYPYYIVQDIETAVDGEGMLSGAGTTTVVLPDTYAYDEVKALNTPCPMIAVNTGASWTFKQLGALLRLTVSGIPSKADKLVVNFDKTVTGAFPVTNPGSDAPYIFATDGASTVTITLVPGNNYMEPAFNIPVPQGSISVTSVVAKNGDDVLTTVSSGLPTSWSAARRHGKKATVAFTPSIASVIFAPGKLYTDESGALKMASSWDDHMYIFSGAIEDPLLPRRTADVTVSYFEDEAQYKMLDRTHFNWNETYYIMSGTAPTSITWTMARTAVAPGGDGAYSYDLALPNNYFGDGHTWRLPNRTEIQSLTRENSTKRGGSKVNGRTDLYYRFLHVLVTDMAAYTGTTYYYPPESEGGERTSGSGGTTIRPRFTWQSGILLFPDNVAMTVDFDLQNYTPNNKREYSWNNKITKAQLDVLISKGCVFLPNLGHYKDYQNNPSTGLPWRFNGVGSFGCYWTNTQGSAVNAWYFNVEAMASSTPNACESSSNKLDHQSIRLVRDIE